MDEFQIETLFERLGKSINDVPEDVQKIFSTLIGITLEFRDRQKKERGVVVTVEDVRIALDWLMAWLKTGQWPVSENLLRIELLKQWARALNLSK